MVNAKSKKDLNDNSNYCVFVILVNQLSVGLFIGLNLSLLNSSGPAIKHYINESYTERHGEEPAAGIVDLVYAIAQSAYNWGSLVGALTVKFVLQRFSLKKAITCSHFVCILSVILMGPIAKLCHAYESLVIGRFVVGIARGIGFSTMMVVVAETSCRRKLGLFQSPFSCIMFVGSAVGAGLGHGEVLGTPDRWIWLVCTPALPSLLYLICWPFIPETPVSLLKFGDREKAVDVLRKLRTTNSDVEEEIQTMLNEIIKKETTQVLPVLTILRDSRLRMQFITALIIMISPHFAGIQAFFNYSDFMLLHAGVNEDYVTFITVGLLLQSLLAFLIYIPVQRSFGTKKVYLFGLSIICIGFVIFIVGDALHETMPVMSYVALGSMFVVLFGIQIGPQLVMLSLPSELTTVATRPTVAFWSGASFWLLAGIVSFTVPYSVGAWGAFAYIPFLVFSSALIPFGIRLIPDTHDRSAVQIQNTFLMKARQSIGTLLGYHKKIRRRRSSLSKVNRSPSKLNDVREEDVADDPTASEPSTSTARSAMQYQYRTSRA